MTTIRQELVTCALCGEQTLVTQLDSTSSFGPPDLDLRPAEPARSSIFAWVERCASCGYCAPSITQGAEHCREIVESPAYRALLADADLPELAKSFLCSSMIFEELDEEAFAARSAIGAAWACDDEDAHELAARCRLRAVERLRAAEADGDTLYDDPSTEKAVLVDLLRRAGCFGDAVEEADAALEEAEGEDATLLGFSRALALARDARVYTFEDAFTAGANDREIAESLQRLVAYGERRDYSGKFVILDAPIVGLRRSSKATSRQLPSSRPSLSRTPTVRKPHA